MTTELFRAVDEYIVSTLINEDDVLRQTQIDAKAAGLPAISVSAAQGKLLQLFVQMLAARRVLEVGTLAGYSAIWMARALPADGSLFTIEFDPRHAEVARQNVNRAGLSARVNQCVGDARDILPQLHAENAGPFDLVFIDADKKSTPIYFEWALKLSRPGSIIIVDNVIRSGRVADAASRDADVQGIQEFNRMVGGSGSVSATAIQTVGAKGYDGFALVRVCG
ncbi:MAG TPA: O-methyltransferase [Tepidisphaeraceae bacterium]|nr:O-methyltransferase [Tepidisphaeraceae bacterium]